MKTNVRSERVYSKARFTEIESQNADVPISLQRCQKNYAD